MERIGIFGSFSQENQNEKSDVDLAIHFEKAPGLEFVELSEYLEKLFGRKVDIITLEGIKSIRIKEIRDDIKKKVV